MRWIFEGLFSFFWPRRRIFAVLVLTLLIFAYLAPLGVEQKGFWTRSWLTVTGMIGSGALAGGVAGWLIGGIGIAALGSAVGIPALAVAAVGGLVGGAVFGGVGSGLMLILQNPDHFTYNFTLLAVLLLASALIANAVVGMLSKLPLWQRRGGDSSGPSGV